MKRTIGFLTFASILMSSPANAAQVFSQNQADSHLRWNISAGKGMLTFYKKDKQLYIKTLNKNLYDQLVDDLAVTKSRNNYINKVSWKSESEFGPHSIQVELKDKNVELFSFYRDQGKKYVVDFWTDGTVETKKVAKAKTKKVLKKTKKINDKVSLLSSAPKKKIKVKKKGNALKNPNKVHFRDFRYGANFIWDYEPESPVISEPLDITRKTAEFFYPIKDRAYTTSNKEAHLQLMVNLFKKKKWGLMYKSIKLFEDKYGVGTEVDFVEYLKANALLRDNLEKGNRSPLKVVINMYDTIAKRTKKYELKKAINQYLFSYYLTQKEYVNALDLAKTLYISSKEDHDYETTAVAAEYMLLCLARLNQVDKIVDVLKDKTLGKLVAGQKILAYEIYAMMKLGDITGAINAWENKEKGLTKPIEKTLLFNIAEAFFRVGEYKKSIKLFDEFIDKYSYNTRSADARMRIALSYDLLGRDLNKVKDLYRNTINRSQNFLISYEARLRYVGLSSIRNNKPTAKEVEERIFIDLKESESKDLDENLKELLWLVRLRVFIKDSKFQEALSYLNAIPLKSLKSSRRRTIESDGAEIVYGLLVKRFKEGRYANLIKIWNLYKNRYLNKVASDPYMNLIVGKSYLKLGFMDSFDRTYETFSKLAKFPAQTYPIWFERMKVLNSNRVIKELSLVRNIKLKNWKTAKRLNGELAKMAPKETLVDYYNGVISYGQNDYKNAARYFEDYLSKQTERRIYDIEEASQLIQAYTDSLYALKRVDKYRQVARAIINDTKNYGINNAYLNNVKERLAYLSLEILNSKSEKGNVTQVEKEATEFLSKYATSSYKNRVQLMLGLSLNKQKKTEEAKKIFESIVNAQDGEQSIKEMAKSELSLINIENRIL